MDPAVNALLKNVASNLIAIEEYNDDSITIPEERESEAIEALAKKLAAASEEEAYSPSKLAKEIIAEYGVSGD